MKRHRNVHTDAIAARDRTISSLRVDLAAERDVRWKTEVSRAKAQVTRIISAHESYIIIDGDEWRNELAIGSKPIPFLERNGAYNGPPADDDAAIQELERLRLSGAGFVVVGKPAFWWLEYYAGFRDYLNSSADFCHNDDLLQVYRLRNVPAPHQEVD